MAEVRCTQRTSNIYGNVRILRFEWKKYVNDSNLTTVESLPSSLGGRKRVERNA